MIRNLVVLAAFAAPTTLPAAVLAAGKVPTKVGQCVTTRIAEIFYRLDGVPDSGSVLQYASGICGVSYDTIEAIARARAGDRVTLCLTALPEDCPPGDERGKTYSAVDLRTEGKWELRDAEHMCGGA